MSALVIFCSNSSGRIKRHRLKIAAGPAAVSLTELIRQTGLQILFASDSIQRFVTREIDGELDVDEALHGMLNGTGLTYEFVNDRTVSVRPTTPAISR